MKADTFAKFYLVAYKPGVGDEDDTTLLAWNGLTDCVKEINERGYWIDRIKFRHFFSTAQY